jgi:HAD superfamily hydrolase (TIGR01509 family)
VTTAHQAEADKLDSIAARWRSALDVAAGALQVCGGCRRSLGFEEKELDEHKWRLAQERDVTAQLLDRVARENHIKLLRIGGPRATRQMIGLPEGVVACVFDLDGVLTGSAGVHAAAWADAFDEFLSRRLELTGERFAEFRPFNPSVDYYAHLHGKPRLEGVHAFLASRGIRLPEGHPDDPAGTETVYGLANRKNEALLHRLEREGVSAYADTRAYLDSAREAGMRLAVVSPSSNTEAILDRAGLRSLIRVRVDGNDIGEVRLRAKPAPDTLLEACRRLDVSPEHVAAFETTPAGVEAARAAHVGYLVGVDRPDLGSMLDVDDADVGVPGLAALLDPSLANQWIR